MSQTKKTAYILASVVIQNLSSKQYRIRITGIVHFGEMPNYKEL